MTGHREGSPSLEEENSSHKGNDCIAVDEPCLSTYQPAPTSRDHQVFVTSPQSFSQNQPPRDISILSVVPMVTHPSMSALSYQIQNSHGNKDCSATNVTPTSNSHFLPENHLSNAISASQLSRETNQNAGLQWNSVFVNPRVADLGSSPSSDYGSYMSDAGTRLSFSGSDSLSGGFPAQNISDSDRGVFDGPFRVPLPVNRDSQQNFADSAKCDEGLAQRSPGAWPLTDCSAETLQCSGNDVPVDMSDLAHLDSLEFDDMFDCDLSHVIPECFTDCLTSSPKHNDRDVTTTNANLATTTCTTPPPSIPLNQFTSANQEQFSQATTSGRSSTTSYVFVKPVSPVRSTVVTSCYVNVTKNTLTSSCETSVSESGTQTSDVGGPDVTDLSVTRTIAQSTSNQVCLIPSASLHQQAPATFLSDLNNNSSRALAAGKTADACCSLQPGNNVVPVSARITDYSPEWCYPDGGAKVLITGEWKMEQGSYTCLFDGCSVPAILYQSGVLRCFCPPHDPGLVTLQVACNGFIVSNACVFEYRARDSPVAGASCHEWLATDNDRFKLAILDRLERLESRLNSDQTNHSVETSHGKQCMTFEDRLIAACEIFQRATSSVRNVSKGDKPFRGMTLLHLSAALGFKRLVCALLKLWRSSDSSLVREEMNPLRKDEFSCTPLTWACALGQTDTALVLLEIEPKALLEPDARGRMPLQLARDRGCLDVVDGIEDFVLSSPYRWVSFVMVFDTFLGTSRAKNHICSLTAHGFFVLTWANK